MSDEQKQTPDTNEPEATRRRRGCIRPVVWALLIGVGVVTLVLLVVWFLIGSSPIEELIASRVESTLEARMGRDVRIGNIEISRGRLTSVIIEDVRIANVKGAADPWFAIIPRVVIEGGVESFRRRTVQVGTIEVENPELFLEIFDEDAPLAHNIPRWRRGEPGRFEIAKFEMSAIDLRGAHVVYRDHRRDLEADFRQISGKIEPDTDRKVIDGFVLSERARIELKDWKPFEGNLRTGFRFADRLLELKRTRFRGEGISADLSGSIATREEPEIDLAIMGTAGLSRIEEIMAIDQEFEGTVKIDSTLKGAGGDFRLVGTVASDRLSAAGYELRDLLVSVEVDNEEARAEIRSAAYGGGTVSGTWHLSSYDDPRPMVVDLNYDSVSLEALLGDWNLAGSGLRGAADGSLHYEFVQDGILDGNGSGRAALEPGAMAFGKAPHPMPVSGSTDFSVRKGVLRFGEQSVLNLPESDVQFAGTLRLDELQADLSVRVESGDFSEIDRLGVNFGRSLGSEDFELLGLGGAGTIDATVGRTLGEPLVQASIRGTDVRYNEVPVGRARIGLTWNGANQTLTFDEARFVREGATLDLSGTIRFPEDGEPAFDLAMSADEWPAQDAIDLVELDIDGAGTASGGLTVDGTPERGTAGFDNLAIRENGSRLTLNGRLDWLPGEGNLRFDLDVGAEMFPVAEIAEFLELGEVPLAGDLTGTLHIDGPVETLGGAGSVTLRNGSIAGEPIDEGIADLRFVQGELDVRHFEVRAPAGIVIGQASFDFESKEFSYVLEPTMIDLSKIEALSESDVVAGIVSLTSSGAGTVDSPEIVVDAELRDGSILGTPIPVEASHPRLYFALREGNMVVRGSALDTLTITGEGRISNDKQLSGEVSIVVSEIERLMSVLRPAQDLELRGGVAVNLTLGGSIESVEAVEVSGSITQMDLEVGGEKLQAREAIRFALSDGRIVLDSVKLSLKNNDFVVDGFVGVTGTQELGLSVRGDVRLALVELVLGDVDTRGALTVQVDIEGSLSSPRLRGTAELRDASIKLAAFPQLISNIDGSFVLRGDRVEINSLRASLGGGSIIAGGFVTLQGLRPGRLRIKVQGEDVTIRTIEGVSLTTTFDLLLSGDLERQQIRGDVILTRGVYYEDFDLTQLILQKVLERQVLVPTVAATWQDDVSLRINVAAADTLAIQNNVADIKAGAELEIVGSFAKPVILGRVTLDEGGTFKFQDIDYRILQGTVSFQNPFRNDPYFDVTAEGVLKSRGQSLGEIEEYELTVNLTGTLDRIVPNISSDPPVGDLTLLTLLSGQVGGTAGLAGRSFSETGTALVLSQVGEAIGGKILPFADAVRFDTIGESGFNPTVTFEKQVSDEVFVIVIYDTASAENVEIIQWQATGDWVLQFTRNSEQTNTYVINAIDARFRRRFEGRW